MKFYWSAQGNILGEKIFFGRRFFFVCSDWLREALGEILVMFWQ
jgi:hypothetical protein